MKQRLLAAFCLATFAIPAMAEVDLPGARKLLEQGKAKSAYQQLAPHEFELAGNLEYDYLLGIAALESGQPATASMIFERILSAHPDHAGARLDMARAWLALGQKERAKKEFLALQQLNPPESARRVIEQNLGQIEQQEKAEAGPQTSGYIEGGLGYDDNITSITGSFSQAVQQTYGLVGITPTGNAVQREDFYISLGGGLAYTAPIKPDMKFIANLDARQRSYLAENDFDTTLLTAQGGVQWKQEQHTWKAILQAQSSWQEGASTSNPKPSLDRNLLGAVVDWRYQLSAYDQAGLSLQIAQVRYPDTSYSNNNQFTLSGNWLHMMEGTLRPLLFSNVYYTHEDATQKLANGTDYSRAISGLRVGGQISLSGELDAFGLIGYQLRRDDDVGARANNIRGEDQLTDLTLGLNWKWRKDWSLTPRVTFMHNESNIPLYSFDRTDLSVMLRRDFR